MTYDECNRLSGLNQEHGKKACRRAWMVDQAIRWGCWLLAGLILMANLVAMVH